MLTLSAGGERKVLWVCCACQLLPQPALQEGGMASLFKQAGVMQAFLFFIHLLMKGFHQVGEGIPGKQALGKMPETHQLFCS